MAAHGGSVVEIARGDGAWRGAGQRSTAASPPTPPMELSGPAAGHALMKTPADPTGSEVLGTLTIAPAASRPGAPC